ncbi:MAG: type II toxin-antitoxin system CcdA family antitoxin [Methanobrevibacter sp.]|nr:type II toxin-antitoxin system CcdA family antitoxin [Methanobrevibacter sp.]
MKKKITVSIDEDILEKAKKQMPNISEFFNECLKQYLGLADGIYPTANASDIIENISKSQAKLFILNQSFDVHEKMKLIEDEKINRPFRALWNDYKRRLKFNTELMQDVLKVVNVDEETLEDVLDFAYFNQDELSLNFSWEEVYEKYQKEVE